MSITHGPFAAGRPATCRGGSADDRAGIGDREPAPGKQRAESPPAMTNSSSAAWSSGTKPGSGWSGGYARASRRRGRRRAGRCRSVGSPAAPPSRAAADRAARSREYRCPWRSFVPPAAISRRPRSSSPAIRHPPSSASTAAAAASALTPGSRSNRSAIGVAAAHPVVVRADPRSRRIEEHAAVRTALGMVVDRHRRDRRVRSRS